MTRRLFAILIFTAVCTQALLGGFRVSVGLCFGANHEHAHEVHEEHHGHACDHHESPFPAPILPDDDHCEDCPCTDVQIDITDLIITHRDITQDVPTPEFSPPVAIDWQALIDTECTNLHPPPSRPPGDLRANSTLAVVRATRLLL